LEQNNPEEICKLTIGQHLNEKWHTVRAKRLTASNFGKICKMKGTTNTAATVERLLYNDFEGTTATKFGQENEGCAVAAFEQLTQLKTEECGIFL
jgi:hypothetical protein